MSDPTRPRKWQPTRFPHPWDSPGKNTRVGCHFLLQCMKVKRESEVAQLCPTLRDPMDHRLPGSSVHGIFQARILEWVAIAFSMTNLDNILKIRDITLPAKVRIAKTMVFPIVMYGCESRTIEKAECWRIDVFKLWCWRRLLRFPWSARRSNQSILKEIYPEYSLEGLMLKLWSSNTLAMWCEELTCWKRPWYWEGLKARGDNRKVGWMASPTQWMWVWADSGRWWRTEKPGPACCRPWGVKESDTTEQQ